MPGRAVYYRIPTYANDVGAVKPRHLDLAIGRSEVIVLVMMRVDSLDASDLAGCLIDFPCFDRTLHSKVGLVFAGVGTPPVGLPGIGF